MTASGWSTIWSNSQAITFQVAYSCGYGLRKLQRTVLVFGGAGDGTLQIMKNIDGYEQTYNGVDFIVSKRMSNNFMFNGSLTLQDQKASYDGGRFVLRHHR